MTQADKRAMNQAVRNAQSDIDFTTFLNPSGLEGARIGLINTEIQDRAGDKAVLNTAVQRLTTARAQVNEINFEEPEINYRPINIPAGKRPGGEPLGITLVGDYLSDA